MTSLLNIFCILCFSFSWLIELFIISLILLALSHSLLSTADCLQCTYIISMINISKHFRFKIILTFSLFLFSTLQLLLFFTQLFILNCLFNAVHEGNIVVLRWLSDVKLVKTRSYAFYCKKLIFFVF